MDDPGYILRFVESKKGFKIRDLDMIGVRHWESSSKENDCRNYS